MKSTLGLPTLCASTVVLALGFSLPVMAGPPADWSAVPAKTVNLFYPGQSTYEWLLIKEHKKGYKKVPEGASCAKCHEGDEEDMGEAILEGDHPLEPEPPEGKNGFIELSVQAAHDNDSLYLRFQWETQSDGPVRLAMMLDDGKVPNFAEQGCWLTCHNGMPSTPDTVGADKVKAHPLFGDGGMKKKDIRKFIPVSRSDGSSWDKTKSAADIAKSKAAGGFLDLVYWRFKDGKPQTKDGYVLEYRNNDAKDSIGDVGKSTGKLADGVYTVIIERKLNTGHAADDKILKAGGVYDVGFAVHDGKVKDRYHHTGFPVTLGIGADAYIKSVGVK